jgi:hypothetical protein
MLPSSFVASKRIFVLGGVLMSAAAMAANTEGSPDILHAPRPCVVAGADYMPGVDAEGRPVAPADIPDNSGIKLERDMSPKIHSANPAVDGMRVTIHIEDPDAEAQGPARCSEATQHR